MAFQIQNKPGKPTAFLFLFGALLFNLSGLPGMNTQAKVFTSDLMSVGCDLEGQLTADETAVARCEGLKKNGIENGKMRVERIKVKKAAEAAENASTEAQATEIPAPEYVYKITSTVPCKTCEFGVNTASRTIKDVSQLREISDKLFDEQTNEVAGINRESEEKLRQQLLCLIDANGKEIKKPAKVLSCRVGKLADMGEEEAAEYYSENIKDQVQKLLQSNNPKDRALGMGVLAKMGEKMEFNCDSRPNLPSTSNPYVNQSGLSLSMTDMDSQDVYNSGEGKELVKNSSCDLWAYGTYNYNMEYLRTAATHPKADRKAIGEAMASLKSGWGSYFKERGIGLTANPGLDSSGQLALDLAESNDALNRSLDAIVAKHADLVNSDSTQETTVGAGRNLRGGVVVNDTVGAGDATINPVFGSTIMKPVEGAGVFTGAPKMGDSVGPQ